MSKIPDFEGSVNVNATITPITRKPIEQVDADKWEDYSITDLIQQKVTLSERLQYAMQHSPTMIKPLQQGIVRLDNIIKNKTP